MLALQRLANGNFNNWLRRQYSSSVKAATKGANTPTDEPVKSTASAKPKSRIVAAAFESLKNDDANPSTAAGNAKINNRQIKQFNHLDEQINNAKTVNGLLSITEHNFSISRRHALKIVSTLAEWSTEDRVKLSEFENDTRFIKICKILGKTMPRSELGADSTKSNRSKDVSGFRTDDLNTVLGVAGDDEAAKLIASISVPQMVRVMSTLAQRKRRSTPLLRSLAYNISSFTEHLDIKQCADILYAVASLNFQDSVLAAKVCADIQVALPKIKDKSAVVGSILTSLGIMKYRDLDILEALTQWTLQHNDICRPQDLSAYFITSAILNFRSTLIEEVETKLLKTLVKEDFPKKADWLNHVWALCLLKLADTAHVDSVLNEQFIAQLHTELSTLSPKTKMKLLNVNGYARLIVSDYKGSLLNVRDFEVDLTNVSTKSKQVLINGLLDTLKSLLPSSNCVQSQKDTKMGFSIDALCAFDAKRNPLPLDKENPDAVRVALMLVDFHDVCHGPHRSVSGITKLCFDLLEKSGYKVIPVPYSEFSTSDKLLKRVQYLESKFKSVISIAKQ